MNPYKLWVEMVAELDQPIPKELVKPPNKQAGIFGEYITGQTAIMLANQVFGAGAWTSEIVSGPEVLFEVTPELGGYVVYTCTARVTVTGQADDESLRSIFHDGVGIGTAQAPFDRQKGTYKQFSPQQLDTAFKAAETDAIKRALKNFGRYLGLDLYLDEKDWLARTVEPEEEPEPEKKAVEPVSEPVSEPAAFPEPLITNGKVTIVHAGKTLTRDADAKISDSRGGAQISKLFAEVLRAAPQFAGKGPYLGNHLNKHFEVNDVGMLTFYQLASLLHYATTGNRLGSYVKSLSLDESAVDAVADTVAFLDEHGIPQEVLSSVSEHYKGKPMTGEDSAFILRAVKSAFEAEGVEGVWKDGKIAPIFAMLLKVGPNSPF